VLGIGLGLGLGLGLKSRVPLYKAISSGRHAPAFDCNVETNSAFDWLILIASKMAWHR
jgi:hypothetical protein